MTTKQITAPWTINESNAIKDEFGITVAMAADPVARVIPEMLALLIESQSSIGGDWRQRRDAIVAKATGAK
jgi:hypothetical protein